MVWIFLQRLFIFLYWLLPILWEGCVRLGQSVYRAVQAGKRFKLMPFAEALGAGPARGLSKWTRFELEAELTDIVTTGGQGKPFEPPLNEILESIAAKNAVDRFWVLLTGSSPDPPGKIR